MGIKSKIIHKKLERKEVLDGLAKIVKSFEPTILDLNLAQLQQGKNNKGVSIKPKYSKETVVIKKALSQPFDRVTLYDQGDFYRGFNLEESTFPFFITSSDSKTAKLMERYGASIFGLDKKSKKELNRFYIQKEFLKYIRKFLHL